jgi:hypothetical protein
MAQKQLDRPSSKPLGFLLYLGNVGRLLAPLGSFPLDSALSASKAASPIEYLYINSPEKATISRIMRRRPQWVSYSSEPIPRTPFLLGKMSLRKVAISTIEPGFKVVRCLASSKPCFRDLSYITMNRSDRSGAVSLSSLPSLTSVPGRITELTERGKLIHRSAYLSNATTCSVQGKALGPARCVNCLPGMMLLFIILHTNFREFHTFRALG